MLPTSMYLLEGYCYLFESIKTRRKEISSEGSRLVTSGSLGNHPMPKYFFFDFFSNFSCGKKKV